MAKQQQKPESCLVCGTTQGRMTRGLCSTHHQSLHRTLRRLTPEGREALEKRLIDDGKLLPAKPGRRSKTEDPFESAFDDLVADRPDLLKKPTPVAFDKPDPADIAKKYRKKKPPQE